VSRKRTKVVGAVGWAHAGPGKDVSDETMAMV
jgi:hypothetical protein